MNIVMLTNTYLPHVGGVARSVAAFAAEYRRRGHQVLVTAPEFKGQPANETGVVRIPAIQNFNGSDFAAPLPVSGLLSKELDLFQPDIVHAHHPYLLGMTALRIARYRKLPLVFTHHTRYEQYAHYALADSPTFRRFVIELATRYANLCNQVFTPSGSITTLLRERGVVTPITVVPTGVDTARFAQGNSAGFRRKLGIPKDAFVVGHLGRLAPEKNPKFLAQAVVRFLTAEPAACFLLVGVGPSEPDIRSVFEAAGLTQRLHHVGVLQGQELMDAYHAMDLFAFTSRSETQGMVLTEAMASGIPVVGLDAPGVREIIRSRHNGCLLHVETVEAFCAALQWVAALSSEKRQHLRQNALATAETFSMASTADKALACYEALMAESVSTKHQEHKQWRRVLNLVEAEWEILKGTAEAAATAFNLETTK